jgi:NAD(P)-dependent dehydrogenase (short-subunit alcohol dehydrogenase family)
MSRRVLVVGASRGIGLGLVDRHLADGWEVHATTRDGIAPRTHSRLTTHRLDVRDVDQSTSLVAALEYPLDRVIHNAGINRGGRAEIMEVNCEAPIRVVQSLLDAGRLRPEALVAIMTSQVGARRGRSGSLGDYGDSKAALNDEFRRRAPAWRDAGVVAVVVHPGWVRTDMGGPAAPLSVDESVDRMAGLFDRLTRHDHGRFFTWDGREHPW